MTVGASNGPGRRSSTSRQDAPVNALPGEILSVLLPLFLLILAPKEMADRGCNRTDWGCHRHEVSRIGNGQSVESPRGDGACCISKTDTRYAAAVDTTQRAVIGPECAVGVLESTYPPGEVLNAELGV